MFNGENIREYLIIAEIYTGCRSIIGRRVRFFMQDLILRKS
jgi:hypothetical protein